MGSLAAVVPARNEAEAIGEVVRGLRGRGACCVLVVDGASSDDTPRRAAAAGAIVVRESRPGYGRACLTGAASAQAHHRHELIAFLDGDGSCDPSDLPRLVAHAVSADMVLGARGSLEVERGAYPLHARVGNLLAATLIAIRGVERELIWSARNMGASDRELMWQIVLPAALPQILTGLQVALPLSMIVAVVAEMLMGGYGLGGAMMTASRFADSRGVFAGIVEIAIVGYVLIKAMAILRRRLLIWHQEANEPTGA